MHLSGSISWNRIHGRRKGAFFTVKVESHLTGKGNFHPIRGEEFFKVEMHIFLFAMLQRKKKASAIKHFGKYRINMAGRPLFFNQTILS